MAVMRKRIVDVMTKHGWEFDIYSRRWTHEHFGWLEFEQVEHTFNERLEEGLERLLEHSREVRDGERS